MMLVSVEQGKALSTLVRAESLPLAMLKSLPIRRSVLGKGKSDLSLCQRVHVYCLSHRPLIRILAASRISNVQCFNKERMLMGRALENMKVVKYTAKRTFVFNTDRR